MSAPTVHMLKLSVGTTSVEELAERQAAATRRMQGYYYHPTRMWPKRAEELAAGGSLYWVIQKVILARQEIAGFERIVGEDGTTRCAVLLRDEIVRVAATPKRPFQGWRYLAPADAPADLRRGRAEDDELPPALAAALAEIGVR